MFSGHEASLDGHRGHNNIREWRTEAFGHDKLKLLNRQPHKPDVGREIRIAAKAGDHARIEALASKGDINETGGSHGHTALHYAARFGHVRAMQSLLRLKADPNARNDDGRTALHWAAANGTAAACELLLSHKGDPRIRNKDGMTPLELAVHFNNAQAIAILRNFSQTQEDDDDVCAERVGVWGGRNIPQAPAGSRHNRHLGAGEVSIQRVGVWHESWAHYDTIITPKDRRHRRNEGEKHYNHGRPLSVTSPKKGK
mmetsp:Transcript_12210/g.42527  ORF Transcript_12210/g.42527 Transcript_12210/m.42527 type:complete len:256 (-) Transcript_12210:1351-2118(-)